MPTVADAAVEVGRLMNDLQAVKARPRSEASAEGALARKLQKLFDDVTGKIVAGVAGRSGVPADEVTRRMILLPLENSVDDFARAAADDAVLAAQRGRNKIIDTLRKQGVQAQFTEMPQTILDRVRESTFTASRNTMRRLVGQVKDSMQQGFEEGLGTRSFAELLQDQFTGMRDFELRRVARTEVQHFQNVGAQQTMRDLGVTYQRWVTAGDDRVRDTHFDVEDEITELDTPHSNGLKYPLDESGPIEEWVNCRCRSVPYIIPRGKAAPGPGPFYESDLIDVKEA